MNFLTNREAAVLIWFFIAIISFIPKKETGKLLNSIFNQFFNKKIILIITLYFLYVIIMLFCLNSLSLWGLEQLKNTIIWMCAVGLVAVFKVVSVNKGGFFKEWLYENFKLSAFISFIVSFYTFHIFIELILQPFIILIVIISIFSEEKQYYKSFKIICDWLMFIIGICIVWWFIIQVWNEPSNFLSLQTLKDFFTPIILSLFFIPFLYAFYIYVVYERVFSTLVIATDDKRLRRYMKLKAFIAFGTDTDFLDRWNRKVFLNKPEDKESVNKIITELLELKKIEKNPPKIPYNEGWSPYEAQQFLTEHNISVRDYHEQYGEWFADSDSLILEDEKLLSDTVHYSIDGNKRAATQLKLYLRVNHSDNNKNSEEVFRLIAEMLFEKATKKSAPEDYIDMVERGEGKTIVNNYLQITASKAEWSIGKGKGYEKKIIFRILPPHS